MNIEHNTRDLVFYFIVVFLFAIFMPLGLGLLLLVLSPFVKGRYLLESGALLVIYSFFLMNLNKEITNDLFWYSQHYIANSYTDLSDVFGIYRYGVPAKITEPLFHLFSYFLSNLTNGNYTVFVFSITSIIYVGSLVALLKFIKNTGLDDNNKAFLIIFFLFFCIIFTQSLHLIRQYLACTILLFSLIFISKEQLKLAFLFALLAGLTHNSTIIVSVLFMSTAFIYRLIQTKSLRFYLSIVTGVLFAFLYISAFYVIGAESRLEIDDGSISLPIKLIDLLLFMISIFIYFRLGKVEKRVELIYCLYISFCVFLIVLHSSHFLSLRYYFYLDFLRWIAVYIFLRYYVFEKNTLVFISLAMVIFGVFYLNLRINSSPFDYGYNLQEYFVYPLITN